MNSVGFDTSGSISFEHPFNQTTTFNLPRMKKRIGRREKENHLGARDRPWKVEEELLMAENSRICQAEESGQRLPTGNRRRLNRVIAATSTSAVLGFLSIRVSA